jgi:hypothetical protein
MFQHHRILNQLPASTLETPPPLILWQKRFCARAATNDGEGQKLFDSPPAVRSVALFTMFTMFTMFTIGKPRAARAAGSPQ